MKVTFSFRDYGGYSPVSPVPTLGVCVTARSLAVYASQYPITVFDGCQAIQ